MLVALAAQQMLVLQTMSGGGGGAITQISPRALNQRIMRLLMRR
jgi:hypothetical protein